MKTTVNSVTLFIESGFERVMLNGFGLSKVSDQGGEIGTLWFPKPVDQCLKDFLIGILSANRKNTKILDIKMRSKLSSDDKEMIDYDVTVRSEC